MYKEYQNAKITKDKLKRLFIEESIKKTEQSVSVNQIIKLANINRSTFYIHYHNMEELILDIENDILTNYDNVLKNANIKSKQDFVDVVCKTATAEQNTLKSIINSECFQKLLNSLRDLLAKYLRPFVTAQDNNQKTIKTIFISSGIVNVLRYCLTNQIDIEQNKKILIDLIN